jgi:hypothetical protein
MAFPQTLASEKIEVKNVAMCSPNLDSNNSSDHGTRVDAYADADGQFGDWIGRIKLDL